MKKKPTEVVSYGDAIFDILNELCNTPLDQLQTRDDLINKLNKGKKKEPPYYGFGDFEFELLIEQGYLTYWEANPEEKKLPKHRKCVIATPKAFELVEARKNRRIAIQSIQITSYIALMAFFVACIGFLYTLQQNIIFAFLGGIVIILFVGLNVQRLIKKD